MGVLGSESRRRGPEPVNIGSITGRDGKCESAQRGESWRGVPTGPAISYTRGSIRFRLFFRHPLGRQFGRSCGAAVIHQPPKRGLLGPIACGLAAAVIVVYLPALWCDFIYDDFLVVHARPVPSGWSEIVSVFTTRQADNLPYYRPLTWLTIDLQNAVHGQSAAAFHAFNVLLASCWALSVFWLLLSSSLRLSWSAALVGALAASVHPVSACAIYPVSSGRETLLAAVAITAAAPQMAAPEPEGSTQEQERERADHQGGNQRYGRG